MKIWMEKLFVMRDTCNTLSFKLLLWKQYQTCHKWFMEEKGQRQTILLKIVFMTKCYPLLFFLQKPCYKLQLALNYWKTCIPMKKEKRKRKEGWTLLCLTQPHSTMIYKCRTTFNSRIFSRLSKLQYMYIETLTNTGTKLFPWGSVKVPYQCQHRRVLKLYLLWLNVLATDKIK